MMGITACLLILAFQLAEGNAQQMPLGGQQCLQCLKMAEAHDCEVVRTCEADEECFTEQYITLEGHIFFDLGCKSKQVCDGINKFGKRSLGQPQRRQSDGRVTLCEECCTGVSCNGKGCDTYNASNSTNRLCYTCSGEQAAEAPGDCEIVTMCGAHEQCYNANGLTNELQLRSAMGCMPNQACNLMYTSGGPNVGHPNSSLSTLSRPVVQHSPSLVGRDVSELYKRHQLKRDMRDIFFKRQTKPDGSSMFTVTTCEYCCDKNYCNNKECVNGFTVTQGSTATTTTMVSTTITTTSMPATTSTTTVSTPTATAQPSTKTSIVSTTMSTASTTTLTTSVASTTPQPSTICYVCSGHNCSMESCTGATPYCLNLLNNSADGSRQETKRCGSELECERDWYNVTALNDICSIFEPWQLYASTFSCTYCCVSNYCNRDTNPPRETLYYPNRQNT